MSVRVFAFTCGVLRAPLAMFIEGGEGEVAVPVPGFLVDHPAGKLLFDTGMHPEARSDPKGRLGPIAEIFRPEMTAEDDVGRRLESLGVDPREIPLVALSHLHFDHAGGSALLPEATLLVQRREWEAGRDADLAAQNGYDAKDYDLGHRLRLVDGEHDVFGDGSVVCLPTHGHTPGHQSLRVRTDGGEVVLTADACYLRRNLVEDRLPPIAFDREAAVASLRRLRQLAESGAQLVYGHDPEEWASVPQAPQPIIGSHSPPE